MSTNTFDIQQGMEVFGSDGEKIGKVGEVHANTGSGTSSGTSTINAADESSSYSTDSNDFGVADGLTRETVPTSDTSGYGAHDVTTDPMDMSNQYGTTPTSGDTGYFTVSEGGILGIGAKELFVPFTAVETVAADGVVTLSYTKDDVGNRFDHQPDEQGDSNSSDMPIV